MRFVSEPAALALSFVFFLPILVQSATVDKRACRPLVCLNNLRKSAQSEIKNCFKALGSDGNDIGAVIGCLTGPVRDIAKGVDGCGDCNPLGDCDMKDRSPAKPYSRSCGNPDIDTIGLVGPNKCAQFRRDAAPGNGDRVWQDYTMHCGNRALDILNRCYFTCSSCDQCKIHCDDTSGGLIPDQDSSADPAVWNEKSKQYMLVNAEGRKKRDLIEARQFNFDWRAPNYEDICYNHDYAFMLGTIDATVNRIGNVRLVKPPLQSLPRDTWTCDHNLELWMVNAFFREYDYPDIWQQITQQKPDGTLDCVGQHLMDLLNSNRNLVGVDTKINSLKNRDLQATPDWATWTGQAVYGTYLYMMDTESQKRTFHTAAQVGELFNRLKQIDDPRSPGADWLAMVIDKYVRGYTILWDELQVRGPDRIDDGVHYADLPNEFDAERGDRGYRQPRRGGQDEDVNRWVDATVEGRYHLAERDANNDRDQDNINALP